MRAYVRLCRMCICEHMCVCGWANQGRVWGKRTPPLDKFPQIPTIFVTAWIWVWKLCFASSAPSELCQQHPRNSAYRFVLPLNMVYQKKLIYFKPIYLGKLIDRSMRCNYLFRCKVQPRTELNSKLINVRATCGIMNLWQISPQVLRLWQLCILAVHCWKPGQTRFRQSKRWSKSRGKTRSEINQKDFETQ